jgi:hypothetical protein
MCGISLSNIGLVTSGFCGSAVPVSVINGRHGCGTSASGKETEATRIPLSLTSAANVSV